MTTSSERSSRSRKSFPAADHRSGRPYRGPGDRPRGPRPDRSDRPDRGPRRDRAEVVLPPPDPSLRSAAFAALGVPDALLDVLAAGGIDAPFPVQAAALPDALAGRDVLGRAPTGSGKTLAYGLALLARVPRASSGAPKALILVPTRELAKQVADVLVPYSRASQRWVTAFFGGAGMQRQIMDLRRGVDIAVATPGRLLDLIRRGDARLDEVAFVVIDEADRMADMGFTPQVRELLDQVSAERQILFFSATLDGDVDELVRDYLHDPVVHEIDGAGDDDEVEATRRARHVVVTTKHERKFQDLAELLGGVGRAIVFVKNRFATERVAAALDGLGVSALAMHGGMSQNAREGALKRWAQGEVVALVATDVAARGVHVAGVETVVHLDPPQDEKDYIHRSGRTARAGATGLVVNLFRKEQLRPAAGMHRRLGVDAETATLEEARGILAALAAERSDGATADVAIAAAPTVHEVWTTARLSETDEAVGGAWEPAERRDRAPWREDRTGDAGARRGPSERGSFGDRGPRPDRGPRQEWSDRGPRPARRDEGSRSTERRPWSPPAEDRARPGRWRGESPDRAPRPAGSWRDGDRSPAARHRPYHEDAAGHWSSARPDRPWTSPAAGSDRPGGHRASGPGHRDGRRERPWEDRSSDRTERAGARAWSPRPGGGERRGAPAWADGDRYRSRDRNDRPGFDRSRPDRPGFDRGAADRPRFDRADRTDRPVRTDRFASGDRFSGAPRADRDGRSDRPAFGRQVRATADRGAWRSPGAGAGDRRSAPAGRGAGDDRRSEPWADGPARGAARGPRR